MSEHVVPYEVPGGPLTADEREALPVYEQAIRESFARAGQSLAAIRDQRLYREDFGSFEAYYDARFDPTNRDLTGLTLSELESIVAIGLGRRPRRGGPS